MPLATNGTQELEEGIIKEEILPALGNDIAPRLEPIKRDSGLRIHPLEEKGLKQKDLALRLGKSEAEISKWMRGTHNFTIDTLVSIEDALMKHNVELASHM